MIKATKKSCVMYLKNFSSLQAGYGFVGREGRNQGFHFHVHLECAESQLDERNR